MAWHGAMECDIDYGEEAELRRLEGGSGHVQRPWPQQQANRRDDDDESSRRNRWRSAPRKKPGHYPRPALMGPEPPPTPKSLSSWVNTGAGASSSSGFTQGPAGTGPLPPPKPKGLSSWVNTESGASTSTSRPAPRPAPRPPPPPSSASAPIELDLDGSDDGGGGGCYVGGGDRGQGAGSCGGPPTLDDLDDAALSAALDAAEQAAAQATEASADHHATGRAAPPPRMAAWPSARCSIPRRFIIQKAHEHTRRGN